MFRRLFILLAFLLSLCIVCAHQPRLVSDELTIVQNPEVSQAFYGELRGEPALYRIESDKPFSLYIGILVPDIEGIDKDVSAEITLETVEEHETILLNSSSIEWIQYYEEFAGDSYYRGPEFQREVDPGIYEIKVFSPDNKGKYVLVVGEKEVFTPEDMINTILTLPKLKQDFFEKSPFTAFFNLIGLFLFIFLLVILVTGFLLFRLSKSFIKKK